MIRGSVVENVGQAIYLVLTKLQLIPRTSISKKFLKPAVSVELSVQAAETKKGKTRIRNERLESAGTMIPVLLLYPY